MFNRKTLPTRSGKLQTAKIDDYNQIEQLSYNVRVTENGIEDGYGFERLTLPTSALSPEQIFSLNATQIYGLWQFEWFDNTANVDKYYIYYMNENREIKYINILSKKTIYVTNITLNSYTPSCATFRINNDNDMIFFSSETDQTIGHGGSGKQVFENIPKFISGCWHGPYLFLVTTGAANKLIYSRSNIDIWNDDNTEEVVIPDVRGGMKKVISVNDNLYLFYEYGIVKLSLYSTDAKVAYSHIFNSSAYIYPNTIAKCGNSIYFLTSEGIFSLEGGQVKKLAAQSEYICESNSKACGECYDDKYFLACKCNFADGKTIGEENTSNHQNNALVVLDLKTQKFSYTRGIDIVSLLDIKTPQVQKLCAIFRGNSKSLIGQLTTDGKFFGEQLPKCWQSKPLDFGSLDEKEIVEIGFKSGAVGDMSISTLDRAKSIMLSNGQPQPVKCKVKVLGEVFTLSFSSSSSLKISYPKIKVKHFE